MTLTDKLHLETKKYIERYMKFYRRFYPDKSLSKDVRDCALDCYERLIFKKISYAKFDEICTAIESEFTEMPYSFNLVGYCLDWIQSEHREMQQSENEYYKQHIILKSDDSEKLRDRLHIKSCLERNQDKLDFTKTFGRCIYRIVPFPKNYCFACTNDGFVLFGVKNTENENHFEPYDNKKSYDVTKVKRCRCTRGNSKTKQCDLATVLECQQAAMINGGTFGQEAPF